MKKKQKAEPESRRKSSYKGNSRNNSKSGGLTFSEKKRLIQLKHILSGKSNEKEKPTTAQKTITFEKMFRDGICQVSHRYYTKMVEFFDINYSLLEVDEQADILAQYSKLINYFDPSVRFELVLFNRQVNEQMLTEQFDIPWQEDDFNDIREEYTEMLKKQAAKGNNGIIKSKYLIFGVESNGYKEAKSRLNNIEKDVIRNLNNIGTLARGLDGKERLRILHEYFNQDTMEPFRFSFKDLAESGKSVKDYIAPPGFDFRYPNRFKSGNMYGCVSYLDIIAPKFTDELIKQLLDIDANLTISMHMQTEDPVKAIKKLKAVISNIQKMKIEEQKKAVRSGYDMDILPTDIVTYEKDTLEFLDDLNTSNQKMINMTFLITCSRMHGIPSIGVNMHIEGTEEWEDEHADIVSGKRIDVDFLNYTPELRDTPKVQDAIKKLIAAYPEKDVIDMEKKEHKIQRLAEELDKLSYDIDTFEYRDSVPDREAQIQMIANDIRSGTSPSSENSVQSHFSAIGGIYD